MDDTLQRLLDEEAADRLDAVRATARAAGDVLLNDCDVPDDAPRTNAAGDVLHPTEDPCGDCDGTLRTCGCADDREDEDGLLDREADGLARREPLAAALRRIAGRATT